MPDPLGALLHTIGPEDGFRCLAALLPDAAVFVVDRDRTIVHWSAGAERMLGFSAAEAEGRLCLSSIRCRQCTLGCGIAKHGEINGFPLEHYRADECWVPTKKYARAFFDDAGEFVGGIEVLIPTGPAQVEESLADAIVSLPPGTRELHGLVSRDHAMQRAFQTIVNVAETDATVLVHGESGTGKQLVAHAIHLESHRSGGPFIPVHCGALTARLLESELFGHVRGAFNGAVNDRQGLFEQASGGTVFLDEVADLPLEMQGKLLRVLEDCTVTPVGAEHAIAVDVRVVAATRRDLRAEVEAGRFREELMYRLRVVPVTISPLRERRGDVEVLVRFFLGQFNEAGTRRVMAVAPEAMRALLNHDWPGNVTELRNAIEYAFAVGRGEELLPDELPPEFFEQNRAHGARALTPARERERIREALQLESGRIGAAAERLGMSRATFWRKRQKYGL